MLVQYSYDAWGKPTTVSDTSGINLSYYNPFRYRGYYYDVETSLYYLHSRYYDPNTGRFVNGDEVAILNFATSIILMANLFSYCFNNPINNYDDTGYVATNVLIAAAIGGVVGAALECVLQLIQGRNLKNLIWSSISIEFLNGALTGALIGLGMNPGYTAFGRALINMVTSIAHSIRTKANFWKAIGSSLLSAMGTYLWSFGTWARGKSKVSKKVITSLIKSLKTRFSRFSIRIGLWKITISI